ncbi:hypothetical protein [Methylotuvimicrobium alcaliphilum]|uniref:Uncharacterized protein n=1 Tax=Methylotuvimicrobium alcaliphilum (strain DSM 19304 / NCIMB 14124 / VKM B-2133 / 20Z) TaxID=1091494 RepID=G4T1E8_META2|nr:hypothetical protein [Methylotuvimicrobium alcaliphilum]CCE25697.1 protein of unknown function [Methylotuvimicrobium alcaliphilum 20Z]
MSAIHHSRKPSDHSIKQMASLFSGVKDSIETLIDLEKLEGSSKYEAMFKIRKNIADYREFRNHNDLRFSREHEAILIALDALIETIVETLAKESNPYLI